MDRMIYQVAVGKQSNLYEHCIKSVANYCKKYKECPANQVKLYSCCFCENLYSEKWDVERHIYTDRKKTQTNIDK